MRERERVREEDRRTVFCVSWKVDARLAVRLSVRLFIGLSLVVASLIFLFHYLSMRSSTSLFFFYRWSHMVSKQCDSRAVL